MIAAALAAAMVAMIAVPVAGRLAAAHGVSRAVPHDLATAATTAATATAAAAGAGGGLVQAWRRVRRRQRSTEPTDVEVATWCEHLASALRGGDSLTHAVVTTEAGWSGTPVVPTVAHAVRRGRGLADALDEVPADPATARGLAVAVLASCARLGGPASSAVDRVADTLQARAAERAERHAASAQARLSARVLTIVPFAVLVLLAGSDPAVRAAVASPGGIACVGAGGALNLLGWWWMRRLIGRTA